MSTINERLEICFPQHRTLAMDDDWNLAKELIDLGSDVSGVVVHCEQFGVFLDLEVGFPAILEVVRFKHTNRKPLKYPQDYPNVGDIVHGRVFAFSDSFRQIALTQRPREDWMHGEW